MDDTRPTITLLDQVRRAIAKDIQDNERRAAQHLEAERAIAAETRELRQLQRNLIYPAGEGVANALLDYAQRWPGKLTIARYELRAEADALTQTTAARVQAVLATTDAATQAVAQAEATTAILQAQTEQALALLREQDAAQAVTPTLTPTEEIAEAIADSMLKEHVHIQDEFTRDAAWEAAQPPAPADDDLPF